MSLADPWVQVTHHDDGSADFTISIDDESYRFSSSPEDDVAILEYEETLTYRGQIEVSEPRQEVWKLLMQSDEMTAYLDAEEKLTGVKRERR